MTRISRARALLMIGGASATLALTLSASPALAQSTTDQASGTRLVASHQRADHSHALADTSGFIIMVAAAPTDASAVTLRANTVEASVRANRSDSELVVDSSNLGGLSAGTRLTSGIGAVVAEGDVLLVTTQRGASSIAAAQSAEGVLGISTDTGHGSIVTLADNRLGSQALGNDATAKMSITGLDEPATSGILAFQSNDIGSSVTADQMAATRIGTGAITGSDIAMSGNLIRALGYGNAFASDFAVGGIHALGLSNGAPASLVPGTAGGDPLVSASFATLSHQEQYGSVTARAGGDLGDDPFLLVVFGPLAASTVRHSADAIVAGGYGNQSDNAMTLHVGAISGDGAVANLTGLQRAQGADVEAEALGGIRAAVLGAASDSRLSLSENSARAASVVNLADRNQLTVEATDIDTSRFPGSPPVGTASTGNDGSIEVTAAFSVQNVQDFGNSAAGARTTTALKLGALGSLEGSRLDADANIVSAAATGNRAANGLTLSASSLRTTADLNNVQSGEGDVNVEAGTSASPVGVILALPATVRNADLSVQANAFAGTAIGNSASNTMAITGTGIANGSGHGEAVIGPLADGYGAAADYALAHSQTLGLSGSSEDAVQIASTVSGRFGMVGDFRAYDSNYGVEGNAVASTMMGNSVANRLSLETVALGTDDASAPGTAISSAQYGQVIGRAHSSLTLLAPASLEGSNVSLNANANRAYAGINEADNGLSLDAIDAGAPTGRNTRVSIGTSPAVSGDDGLANLQFAGGSIAADAVTAIENGDAGIGLFESRFGVEGNVTAAEATANRAANAVDIDVVAGGGAATGLGNMQMNTASVAAVASLDAGYRVSPSSPTMIDGSSLTISDNATTALARGNAADNQMVVAQSRGPLGGTAASQSSRFDLVADAGVLLLNGQTNYGSVTASASNSVIGTPFNSPIAGMSHASIELRGNTISSAAYGNSAANTVSLSSPGTSPSAAIVSNQVNYGPVSAFATGNQLTMPLGALTGSNAALAGNQLSAVAVGNQAVSTISTSR